MPGIAAHNQAIKVLLSRKEAAWADRLAAASHKTRSRWCREAIVEAILTRAGTPVMNSKAVTVQLVETPIVVPQVLKEKS